MYNNSLYSFLTIFQEISILKTLLKTKRGEYIRKSFLLYRLEMKGTSCFTSINFLFFQGFYQNLYKKSQNTN